MTERIKHIMEQEGLSAAQFADAIGIQRSRISHILLGRNNPSLDLVTKILTKFPNYDSDWLLFDKQNTNVTNRGDVKNLELSLFGDESELKKNHISKQKLEIKVSPKPEKKNAEIPKEESEEKLKAKPATPIKNEKKITSIILVYDDGTFRELRKDSDAL